MSDKTKSKGPGGAAKSAKRKASAKEGAEKQSPGEGGRERDQVDLFIEEVTEELQRERAYKLFKTYGPFVGAAVVLIVLAASVNEYMKSAATSAARETGSVLISAFDAADREARIEAFDQAAQSQEGGAALLARLHQGALQAEAKELQAAAGAFDAAASTASEQERPIYADLAVLRGVLARFDTLEASETIAILEPLTAPERPLRAFALELLGLAQAKAGKIAEAKATLEESEIAWGASQSARTRVRELIEGLGAGAKNAKDGSDAAGSGAGSPAKEGAGDKG